jgi:hypothetical protein
VVVLDINPEALTARRLEPATLLVAAGGDLRAAIGVYVR